MSLLALYSRQVETSLLMAAISGGIVSYRPLRFQPCRVDYPRAQVDFIQGQSGRDATLYRRSKDRLDKSGRTRRLDELGRIQS